MNSRQAGKRYEQLNRLIFHAQKLKLPIIFACDRHFDRQGLQFSDAYFSPLQRKIWIRKRLSRDMPKLLYITAHEIGHCVDYDRMKKRGTWEICLKVTKLFRYMCDEVETIPKQVRWFMLGCERRAFDEADTMLDKLEIFVKKSRRMTLRQRSLRGYKSIIARVNKAARHRKKNEL